MKKEKVLIGQSIWDIAAQYYGAPEGVAWLILDNPSVFNLENSPVPGTSFIVREEVLDKKTVEYFAARNIKPATAVPDTLAFDPDAQLFITATAITDPSLKSAINALVVDLKISSLWSKLKAIYPMVGGNSSAHMYNLKDVTKFQLTWYGGWIHSNTGAKPNGINAYAKTGVNASSELSQNNAHLSYYSRTNDNGSSVEIGCENTYLMYDYSGQTFRALNAPGLGGGSPINPTIGFYLGSRTTSAEEKYYLNGAWHSNATHSSSAPLSLEIIIGALKNTTSSQILFSGKECAFASIGEGLTAADALNLNAAVHVFQTALSRNV